MSISQELHVVFGGGAVGKAVARELLANGKQVRIVTRSGSTSGLSGAENVAGDASNPTSTKQVCRGASVVYHCAGAPYTDWATLLPPMQAGIIEGAAAAGAKLVVAENFYMYGPVSGSMGEDTPYQATTRKGRIRAQLAESLMQAHAKGIVRATSGRSSNFYGPDTAELGAFGGRILYPLLAGKPVWVFGNPDTPHSYTYIEDYAKGLIILGTHDEALGQSWHIPNAPAWTTRQILTQFFEDAGLPPRIAILPDGAIKLLGFFNPLIHEVEEMLYESKEPFVADSSKFVRAFGDIATPLPKGIQATLNWFRTHPQTRSHEKRKEQTPSFTVSITGKR